MSKKRIIAFDVGDVWIGVAQAYINQQIAFPYQTWKMYEFEKKFSEYLAKNNIEKAVIGLPLTLTGNKSQQTIKVEEWVWKIKKQFPTILYCFQDERFSSQFATNIVIFNNNKSKNSNHSLAATIILENYLQKIDKLN